jgi:HSP20 family protein
MAYPGRYLGRDFDALRREMDRLFHDFVPTRPAAGEGDAEQAVWAPRADMAETEDAFVIALDVPGVGPDDLQITFEEDTLKVSGERQFNRERHEGQFHRIERSYGRFFRAFRFGSPVDVTRVEADFEDGVLTIRVPKAEASKPRRIEVRPRAGSAGGPSVEATPAPDATPPDATPPDATAPGAADGGFAGYGGDAAAGPDTGYDAGGTGGTGGGEGNDAGRSTY